MDRYLYTSMNLNTNFLITIKLPSTQVVIEFGPVLCFRGRPRGGTGGGGAFPPGFSLSFSTDGYDGIPLPSGEPSIHHLIVKSRKRQEPHLHL